MPSVELDLGRTAYVLRGSLEAKTVVLVFGGFHFPRNCDPFFDRLAEELGSDFAVVSYDAYGRGDSARPRARFDAELYLSQGDGLVKALGLGDRRLVALGYSFGGSIATRFAQRFPERVKALIVSGGWLTWAPVPAAMRLLMAPGVRLLPWAFWWSSTKKAIVEGFRDRSIAGPYADHMIQVEKRIVAKDVPGFRHAILDTMFRFPRDGERVVREIGRHDRPVLLVWGDRDNVAPLEHARAMHSVMPRSELIVLEGSHNDLWLVPGKIEELLAAFTQFLRAL